MGKMLDNVLAGGPITDRELREAEEVTYVRIDSPVKVYTSYIWMIVTSAIIATGGIAANSSAVVIGAMLVAPLMSPIVGTTLAAVTGQGRAAARTLLMTMIGMALGVAVSFLVAAIIPVAVDTSSNAEVVSRTSPRLVDMVVALGAGIIAALAIIREDISAVIPGVAIAASLMPPLCVIGIALFAGDFTSALGAFLLFMANYFAIQLTGIVVFLLLGLGRDKRASAGVPRRVAWYAAIVIGFVVVSIPLAVTSSHIVSMNNSERAVSDAAEEWLSDGGYELRSVNVRADRIEVTIAGEGDQPSIDDLGEMLADDNVDASAIRVITLDEKRID